MLRIVRGADHINGLVQHQITMAGKLHDFTMQHHHLVRAQLQVSFGFCLISYRYRPAADQLFRLLAGKAGTVGKKIVQTHGQNRFQRNRHDNRHKVSGVQTHHWYHSDPISPPSVTGAP